ncbi:MAG: glucokinase, partial [Acidobacteria bacterium]
TYNPQMLLAGDVGGTKTLIGLFAPDQARPRLIGSRTYRTIDYPNLRALTQQFLRDTATVSSDIEAASFGVAGPVDGMRARLTNVPWIVDVEALGREMAIPRAHLLNDLEALAWSVPFLDAGELELLHAGEADPRGNMGLIAAGTGLGIALIANIDGRLVPRASEGGHADFAPRNDAESRLAIALAKEFGRVDVERVVSGPGLAHIHRLLYPHQCATLTPLPAADDLPAAISRSALEAGCADCRRTLELFVSAYGAAAGNLALTVLATGGLFLGGGIAPQNLDALRWPTFMQSFLDKSPMTALVSRMPVKVIMNPGAGLLGAATHAHAVMTED